VTPERALRLLGSALMPKTVLGKLLNYTVMVAVAWSFGWLVDENGDPVWWHIGLIAFAAALDFTVVPALNRVAARRRVTGGSA